MTSVNLRRAKQFGIASGEIARAGGAGFSWTRPDARSDAHAAFKIEMDGNLMTIRLTDLHDPQGDGSLALSDFSVDSVSRLNDIAAPVSPQLAATPAPGQITGTQSPVSDATGPLEPGVTYLVTCKVTAASIGSTITLGDAFAPKSLSARIGVHHMVAVATDNAPQAFLTVTGTVTFEFVSLRRAEWQFDQMHRGAEQVLNPNAGWTTATGGGVGILSASGRVGPLRPEPTEYELIWTITSDTAHRGLFHRGQDPFGSVSSFTAAAPGTGSAIFTTAHPEGSANLSGRLMSISGSGDPVVFSYFSCRQVVAPSGRAFTIAVKAGNATWTATGETPSMTELYVSPDGSDDTGTGSITSPLRTPLEASLRARPGYTIYLRPGLYPRFEIQSSGEEGAPITFTTLPGEERQAIIDGGLPSDTPQGIFARNKSYISIQNLTIRNIQSSGVYFIHANNAGIAPEEPTRGIHFEGNLIDGTQNSGLRVFGIIPPNRAEDDDNYYIQDIVIRGNEIKNAHLQGNKGSEIISIAAGVQNVLVEYNDVHDSWQYAVDFKRGVLNGVIRYNRFWNMAKFGVYLDTSSGIIENIEVYGNIIWNCNVGITFTREMRAFTETEDDTPNYPEGFPRGDAKNVKIWNNTVFKCRNHGILSYAHNRDGAWGRIEDISIRFNTVYDCNISETPARSEFRLHGFTEPLYLERGIVSDFDVIGNVAWRDPNRDSPLSILNAYDGVPGFLTTDNFNFGPLETRIDPMFVAPDLVPVIPEGFTVGQEFANMPDFRLQPGSPAIGTVSPEHITPPFEYTKDGTARSINRAPGAF